jgi:hypothetical protein
MIFLWLPGLVEKHPVMLYLKEQDMFPPNVPEPVFDLPRACQPNETG